MHTIKEQKRIEQRTDIWIESNPYQARVLINTEMILALNLKITEFILKLSKGEKLNDDKLKELIDLQKKFSDHISSRNT